MTMVNLGCNRSFFKNIIRSTHKYICGMNKAYLRRGSDADKFDMTFQFTNPALKVNRKFNFSRPFDENVSAFLNRVNSNLEKIVLKANKKNPLDNVSGNASLLINDVKIDENANCQSVFSETNKVTLKVFEQEFEVIINAPFIDCLALPSIILATFPVYPAKFEATNVDQSKSTFKWFKSPNKKRWEAIGSEYICRPGKDCVDHFLKLVCEPKNEQLVGPEVEIASENVVTDCPTNFPFRMRHEFTKIRSKPNEVRIVSYNILADLYCDSDFTRQVLHPYCPANALNIEYRKQLLIEEILGYNSDIICLQEVDRKVFKCDLEPIFSKLRYASNFTLKGGQVAEGVACFYHLDKFQLVGTNNIILAEELPVHEAFADLWGAINTNAKLKERIIERKTALQVTILECIENGKLIIAANTHLYFHPDADHIRLLQGAMCIKFIESIYKTTKEKYPDKSISVVFCGDFNSTPDSGIYSLYTVGKVAQDVKDWSSNVEEKVTNLCIEQPFKLASACGTPEFTNYTVDFADCLDYIYFDSQQMDVSQSVPLPTNDELILNTALPSVVFPSDHISLCADLRWK